jgi:hypothetical protein
MHEELPVIDNIYIWMGHRPVVRLSVFDSRLAAADRLVEGPGVGAGAEAEI